MASAGHGKVSEASVMIAGVNAARIDAFMQAEAAQYHKQHLKSAKGMAAMAGNWLSGVPMHWMQDWPMPHLAVIQKAKGAKITTIDGHKIDDFCLGDTGSMFGHSPKPVAKAMRAQAKRGLTYMLPSAAAAEAGRLLSKRFGKMRWQVATTASDANRYAIRVARAVTARPKILVFNGCYHGTVDDVMVCLEQGETRMRPGLMGQVADLTSGAVCVEFNDLAAVKAALAKGDVAAILTEPVMTNSCMVLPEPGFMQGLRDLATAHGSLLILDETHTLSSGLGGYTGVHGLEPDIFVVGKCVAGGVPTAVWGLREAVAERYATANAARAPGHSGMGTTLSANPMQFAALVANLSDVMTARAYHHMERGAERLAAGLSKVIAEQHAPWHVARVGARVEFICAPKPLANGSEAAVAHHPKLEAALHLGLLNRGSLIAPFHNMMLVSPATGDKQIDRLTANFKAVTSDLFSA